MGNDNILEIINQLIKERDTLADKLARVNASIAALSNGAMEPAGAVSPSVAICRYLKQANKPALQIDIIRTVANERKQRYPSLTNHRTRIWQALAYHIRKGTLISCVDPQTGRKVPLKPLPKRPRKIDEENDEQYAQDNWFVLKEKEIAEGRYASAAGKRTSGIAGL